MRVRTAAAAPPDAATFDALCWPPARLGDAVEALARAAGCARRPADLPSPPSAVTGDAEETQRWLHWAAARLGVELEPAFATVPEAASLLPRAGPALVPWTDRSGARGVLLLLAPRRGQLRLLAPDGRLHKLAPARLRQALCQPHEAPLAPEIDGLLAPLQLSARRHARVRAALLRERLADARLAPWWQLRLPASAPLAMQAWQAGLPQRLLTMLALFAAFYAGEVSAWAVIGESVLDGRLDAGWLAAWALLLLTLLPLRLAGSRASAGFARRAAALLKARLLVGALHLEVDRVRRDGVGRLLGRVIESSALESLALGGGLTTVVALLELLAAAVVLALGAAPGSHLPLLVGWTLVVLLLCTRLARRLAEWTAQRLTLTHDLIEQMVGHRTRLAQERPDRRAAHDDAALDAYLHRSQALDGAHLPLPTWLPAGWMILALALLVPAFLAEAGGARALAISVGGILLAQRAFSGMAAGLGSLARAAIAWREVAELYRAAASAEARVPPVYTGATAGRAGAAPLVDAQGLQFAYAGGRTVLRGAELRIGHGERVLLQGASGGGKSTLAALLTGLRRPQAGLLLLQGLDAPTLGDQWHRLATAAPQFHENHILSGTVAFNLLMGSQWPPTPAGLAEAQQLCEELGLGALLRRMPAGLQQRIGETGWQISHGERSRIFLARALLQRAPLVVLDESFAALDPESLAQCLRCVHRHAQTLVVIAHP